MVFLTSHIEEFFPTIKFILLFFQSKSSKNVYVKYQTEEHILGDRRNDLT